MWPFRVSVDFSLLQSEEKKPPKGFEKFFKRKENKDTEKNEQESESQEKKADQQEKQAEPEDEGAKSDHEKEEKKPDGSLRSYFFDPDNNPKPESWIGVLVFLTGLYWGLNYKKPAKELIYMDFLNNYLLKN